MNANQKPAKRKPYRALYRIHGQYVDRLEYYAFVRREEEERGIPALVLPRVYNHHDPVLKRRVNVSLAEYEENKRRAADRPADPRRGPFYDLLRAHYAGIPILLTDKVREILEYDPPEFRS